MDMSSFFWIILATILNYKMHPYEVRKVQQHPLASAQVNYTRNAPKRFPTAIYCIIIYHTRIPRPYLMSSLFYPELFFSGGCMGVGGGEAGGRSLMHNIL